jgi:predicted nucleotidyltransferase
MQTWSSYKARTEGGRFQTAHRAIAVAISRLSEHHNGNIVSVVLFGSLARRRPTYHDIDLLVVTDQAAGSPAEATRRLAEEVFGPLFWEYGELFSPLIYTAGQLAQLQGELPLLETIRREGVLLYGQDPFTKAPGSSLPADR